MQTNGWRGNTFARKRNANQDCRQGKRRHYGLNEKQADPALEHAVASTPGVEAGSQSQFPGRQPPLAREGISSSCSSSFHPCQLPALSALFRTTGSGWGGCGWDGDVVVHSRARSLRLQANCRPTLPMMTVAQWCSMGNNQVYNASELCNTRFISYY